MTRPRVRLAREGESIYRIWVDGVRVGSVAGHAEGWTGRLLPPRDARWAWQAPRRRDAVSQLVRHVEESP